METRVRPKKVWIDGDTLVRKVGEAEENEYLFGNGFQAKLTKFIKERDEKLKADEALLNARKNKTIKQPEMGEE